MSIAEAIIDELFPVGSKHQARCHSFGGEPVVPARKTSGELGDALFLLISTRIALDKAKREVPDYTAQWSDADYYANEQEAYNRACDELEDAVLRSVVGLPRSPSGK